MNYKQLRHNIIRAIFGDDVPSSGWRAITYMVRSGKSRRWNLFGVNDEAYQIFIKNNYIDINNMLLDIYGSYTAVSLSLRHCYTVDDITAVCSGMNDNVSLCRDILLLTLDLLCLPSKKAKPETRKDNEKDM